MALISWSDWPIKSVAVSLTAVEWPGYVKGLEVSAIDLLALTLYLSLPPAQTRIPFRISMALYFAAAAISTFQAAEPIAAVFYLWQLARMFLVFAVVTRACTDARSVYALLTGMAMGLFLEVAVELWQRFGLGILQASGNLASQNLLGMMSHFVIFPFLALLLVSPRLRLPLAVVPAALIADVLTASRASIGIAAAGCAALFMLSALRRWTPRKQLFLLLGGLSIAALGPFALWSLDSRFATHGIDPYYDERAAFQKAAEMILADHPMGIGVNHYVLTANNGGYNHAAGVTPHASSLLTNVHNLYLLVAAESGYVGLAALLLLLLHPLIVAIRCGWKNGADPRGDLLLGFGTALAAVYVHSFFEWVFIDFQLQYMFALTVGAVASLAIQLGYFKQTHSRLRARPFGTAILTRRREST